MILNIQYEIPDEIGKSLQKHWGDMTRKNLEGIAVIGYNTGVLTSFQVQKMLDLSSRWKTEEFLQKNNCYLHYDKEDLEHDLKDLDKTSDKK